MAIGRNDLCYCGSGKKYKKCCLGKEEVQGGGFLALESREAIIKQLQMLIGELEKYKVIPRGKLDDYILKTATLVMSKVGTRDGEPLKEALAFMNVNECLLILELCKSFKLEYMMLTAAASPDYSMMRIMASATVNVLIEGIDAEKYLRMLSIDYDHKDQLVGQQLVYGEQPSQVMYWCNCVEQGVDFEQSKIESSLAYLDEEAKENLAAIRNLELKYEEKNDPHISYTTLVANYLNLMTRELVKIKAHEGLLAKLYDEKGIMKKRELLLEAGVVKAVASRKSKEMLMQIVREEDSVDDESSMTQLIEELALEDVFYDEIYAKEKPKSLLEGLSRKVKCLEKITKEEYDVFKDYMNVSGLLESFSIDAGDREMKLKNIEILLNAQCFKLSEIEDLGTLFEIYTNEPYRKDYEYKLEELYKKIPYKD